MKTIIGKKLTRTAVVALTLLISSELLLAQRPENAALFYYQAFMLLVQQDEATRLALEHLIKGKIKSNEKSQKYVESNRQVINLTVKAAEIPNCDWGLDYSEGLSTPVSHLGPSRNLVRLILADARILAEKGNYKLALGRCLTVQKVGKHFAKDDLMTYLVGTATTTMANECIQQLLADMPQDMETLTWLKNQLAKIHSRVLPLSLCLDYEAKGYLTDMRKDRIEKLVSLVFEQPITVGPSPGKTPPKTLSDAQKAARERTRKFQKTAKERVRVGDEKFFERNRAYHKDHIARIKAALDLPYAQAYTELKKLHDQPQEDAIENPDATLTAILTPPAWLVYNRGVIGETLSNAIRTAVGIYIIKAKTGQLPDTLPAGLPKDLFSGKDFEYERKDSGFILHCRGKDLRKDKIHEYEFKVSK